MPASQRASQVFLNVPYGPSFERMLVALTAALVALGRIPRLTFQVPDQGQGRMPRIFKLVKSCPVSIHDLSAVGMPVRFNMPFELGLAWAVREQTGKHQFVILEKQPHRFDKHLSDLKYIDPKIHHGRPVGAICAVLEVLNKPGGNPSTSQVLKLYRYLMRLLPALKRKHGVDQLFTPTVYRELVTAGYMVATDIMNGTLPHRA
jgi:hypothetical protein